MAFNDKAHQKRLLKLNEMWESLKPLSHFAKEEFGIDDIFQDNDGKVMQQLTCLDFLNLEGREGNDGIDENGVEWEMKSVNVNKTSSISTHHHLNTKIIEKYRMVPWSFAVYNGVQLMQIYAIHPDKLDEEYFKKWEITVVEQNKQLNNPKINLVFVRREGTLIYSKDELLIQDPKSIYDMEFMKANLAYDFSPSTLRTIEEVLDELDNIIMGLSNNIEKITTNQDIEYVINEEGFLKIIIHNKHLKLCIYLDDNKYEEYENLSKTKGKQKARQGMEPNYNYSYKLNNKKSLEYNPIDEPFELIKLSFNFFTEKVRLF